MIPHFSKNNTMNIYSPEDSSKG